MQDHGLAWHAGKYVLYSPQKNHFFGAEVFEDGSAAVFLSHKRHICLTFSATDMGTVARDWRVFRVEQGCAELREGDVVGGSGARLTEVMQCVDEMCPVPMASLCEMRVCSKHLQDWAGDLQERFKGLRKDVLKGLRRVANGHVLPPRFIHRTMPRITWDLYFCEGLAALHFPPAPFYGEGLDGACTFGNAWRWRNKADEAAIDYVAKRATRERHYSQWQLVQRPATSMWLRRSARAVELLVGPARVFLCFEETTLGEDLGERVKARVRGAGKEVKRELGIPKVRAVA